MERYLSMKNKMIILTVNIVSVKISWNLRRSSVEERTEHSVREHLHSGLSCVWILTPYLNSAPRSPPALQSVFMTAHPRLCGPFFPVLASLHTGQEGGGRPSHDTTAHITPLVPLESECLHYASFLQTLNLLLIQNLNLRPSLPMYPEMGLFLPRSVLLGAPMT